MKEHRREEFEARAKDGTSSRITVFTGAGSSSDAPVFVCLPAMGISAKYYEPLSVPVLREGWHFIMTDLRGNGSSSVRPSKEISFGYHEMVAYDWPAFVGKAKDIFPGAPLYLLGHSLGGQLSCLYLGANPGAVSGIILVAAPSVYYRGWDFPANLGILAVTRAFPAIAGVLGYFPGKSIGFGGTEARGVIRDWAHQGQTGRYEPEGSALDFEKLMGEIESPVLAISLAGDSFAPQRAVANLCAKMPRSRMTRLHLGGSGLGHITWVRHADPVVSAIRDWLAGL